MEKRFSKSLSVERVIVLIVALALAKQSNSADRGQYPSAKLVFKSGYEEGTHIARSSHRVFSAIGLLGLDHTTNYSWTEIDQGTIPHLTDLFFYNQGGTNEIIDGTFLGRAGKILKMEIEPGGKRAGGHMIFDHPTLSDNPKAKKYQPENPDLMLEFTFKHKLYIHTDYNKLRSYPGQLTWWQVFEFKNWGWAGNDWRGNATIRKDKNSDKLFWVFHTEYIDQSERDPTKKFNWQTYFKDGRVLRGWLNGAENRKVPVPIGEWFDLEIYFKEGDINSGRFAMRVNGQYVFDLEIATRYPAHPTPIRYFFPYKHYIDPRYTTFMGGNSIYYYDDFEFWEGNALLAPRAKNIVEPISDEQVATLRRAAAAHFDRKVRITATLQISGKKRVVRVKDVSSEGIAVVFRGGKADVQWEDVPAEVLARIAYGLRNHLSAEELKALAAALNAVGRAADARKVLRAAKQRAPEKRRRRDSAR